jgi:hypothetical protein
MELRRVLACDARSDDGVPCGRVAEQAAFREGFQREISRDEAEGGESEEAILAAWRAECERKPVELEAFRRARAQRRHAASEAAAAEEALTHERMRTAAREAARRDGVDVELLDKLYETLRSEGVDTSDVGSLHRFLRGKGVDPEDRHELEAFARQYTQANPTYGGISWGAPKPSVSSGVPDEDEDEDISTEGMRSSSDYFKVIRA